MRKSSFWISAAAALALAMVLAGCGKTFYFAGRTLPPSKLVNRVLIAVQNPSVLSKGTLDIVDGFYDERSGYNGNPGSFSISGYGGALPISIQNMPEEQRGAVYGAGDGSLSMVNYATESTTGNANGLVGLQSSVFITRNQNFVFAASQASHILTVATQGGGGATSQGSGVSTALGLPGIYRVSVNPGGTVALAFVQNSNYIYYPRQLTTQESLAYSGGPATWPKAAIDCEPQNAPLWCLLQAQSPDHVDATGNYYGAPLTFDRPVKAIFSSDGSTAYVLNCGPECGGAAASITPLPIAPLIFNLGQFSGTLPTQAALAPCSVANNGTNCTLPIPGGASNALLDSSTMYVVGQQPQTISGQTFYGGNLTVLSLASGATGWATASSPVSISDGQPGAVSRLIEADDNTLWIGMQKCTNGVRFATNAPGGYGCLTMYNTATKSVVMLEPYLGDATGIAAVTNLHKIYTAEGGQVYIYSTKDGHALDNQYVTVTGTAWDVAYMDGITDTNNTVY